MTNANLVANKSRVLYEAALTADAAHPTFPGLDVNPRSFAGDFTGAEIAGFEFENGALTTVTALDANIEHSDDGTNWYVLKALTQATAAAKTYTELDDTDPKPMRYLRVDFTATGSYGSIADVKVSVKFCQPHAKGPLAPPGYNVRRN